MVTSSSLHKMKLYDAQVGGTGTSSLHLTTARLLAPSTSQPLDSLTPRPLNLGFHKSEVLEPPLSTPQLLNP